MRVRVMLGLLAASACVQYTPPAPASPRAVTEVPASFGKTWDAVIDVFAEENIPIQTMERASGFIAAAHRLSVPAAKEYEATGHPFADCGKENDRFVMPQSGTYNVVVRGDSARSTVRVTATYTGAPISADTTGPIASRWACSSRGEWEAAFESDVRARATGERRPLLPADVTAEACAKRDAVRVEGQNLHAEVYSPGKGTCVRYRCQWVDKATTMTAEAAIARCRVWAAEAQREP
jgi:hypothetical protein